MLSKLRMILRDASFVLIVVMLCNTNVILSRYSCQEKYTVLDYTRDVKRMTFKCNVSTELERMDNYTWERDLWIELVNCSIVPEGLFISFPNKLQKLTVSAPEDANPEITIFPTSVFDNLTRLNELQLIGFENVEQINADALSELIQLRCLYLDGFGRRKMSYDDMLRVLQGLPGTSLTSLVLNNTKSILNSKKIINFNVLAVPNLTLERLAIDKSVVESFIGQLSKIQPALTSVSLSVSSRYNEAVETLLDTIFFMPNIQTLHIYGYPGMSLFSVDLPLFLKFIKDNIDVRTYFTNFFDSTCYLKTKIRISPKLTNLSINFVQTINIPEWPEPYDPNPMCISENNSLVSLDLSNNGLGNLRTLMGIPLLIYLRLQNSLISTFSPEQLKHVPLLEELWLSDNDIGESIAADYSSNTFRRGQSLVMLDLARCNLTQISKEQFSDLASLQYVNLAGNRLQLVNFSLANNPLLKHLNLSNNLINIFSESFIKSELDLFIFKNANRRNVTSLEIDLYGNPLSCLCNASSFIRWMQSQKGIVFARLRDYLCLYPNGTWSNLVKVDTHKLNEQCEVINDLQNNTNCPCDIDKLNRLYSVRYSLAQFYCIYDGKLIQMKQMEPSTTAKACMTTIPVVVVPVVVLVSVLIIVVVTIVFAIVYRRKRPDNFHAMMACLDPRQLTGYLMVMWTQFRQYREGAAVDISYDAFFAYSSQDWNALEQKVISKLVASGFKIITDEEIVIGSSRLDALLEIIQRCRSIVLVLSPEFITDEWCCIVARRAAVSRCVLIPLVYRPINLTDSDFLFSDILSNYLPIYWSEDVEQQSTILRKLNDRLKYDILSSDVELLLA